MNKVILIGRLGGDPETRYTQGGDAVTTFSVATSEKWKAKDGGKQERTDWHNVVAFGRQAEVCAEYLRKGSQVMVEGQIRTESYEKDGQKRYSTKIYLRTMEMLGGKPEERKAETTQPTRKSAGTMPQSDISYDDEEIPF